MVQLDITHELGGEQATQGDLAYLQSQHREPLEAPDNLRIGVPDFGEKPILELGDALPLLLGRVIREFSFRGHVHIQRDDDPEAFLLAHLIDEWIVRTVIDGTGGAGG